jgi:ABC-2 type transport system permease protein
MVDTFAIVARCGILLILYSFVFKLNNGNINGTTFIFAAWSIFFYFSFSVFRLRDIPMSIMQDVQSGNVEVLLSKPISYLSYRMWWSVGYGLYSFVAIATAGSLVLALLIGLAPTMHTSIFIPTFIMTIIFGSILTLSMYGTVGLLAFWIEDITPIFWIVDKSVMILGGSYLPVALFPSFMYKLSLYSPFGATQFITHTVSKTWQTNWYQLIGIQLLWIIFFTAIMYFMFEKAKKKISVNGG